MNFVDTLKKRLDHIEGDELLQTLSKLADLHLLAEPEASIKYAERALELAQALQDAEAQANALINKGRALIKVADYQHASTAFDSALAIAEELSDEELIDKAINGLGNTCWYLCDYENSLKYNLRLLDSRKRCGNQAGVASALNNIGLSYRSQGQFRKALAPIFEALTMHEELGNEKGIAASLNTIGLVQYHLRQFDKSLESHTRALALRKKLGDEPGISHSLNNIGTVYSDLGQYDKALDFLSRSLKLKRRINDTRGEANALNNIGDIYRLKGNPHDALKHYKKSLKSKKKLQDLVGISNSAHNIANCHLQLDQLDEALPFIQEGEAFAKSAKARDRLQETYTLYGTYYEKRGDHVKSLEYLKRLIALKDELYDEKTISHLAELSGRYESERKSREVDLYRTKMQKIQSVLSDIANAVREADSIDEMYALIKISLSQLIDTTNFYIALYDKQTDMINLPLHVDNKDNISSFPAHKTMTSMVIKSKKPILANTEMLEKMMRDGDLILLGEPAKIWLGVPMMSGDEVIGVIAVQSYTDESMYKEEDLELLQFVSFQVALSIERKHHEEELKFHAKLLDNIRDEVIATDLSGKITYVNKAVHKMMGYSQEELVGQSVHILGEENEEGVSQQTIIEHTIEHGFWRGTAVNVTRDGELKHLDSRTWLIFDENDQPKGMVGVSTDISERRRTEAERMRLATAIEQAAEAVIITDREGKIEYVNPAFEQVTGYDVDEVTGKRPSFLKSGKHDVSFYSKMWKTILSGNIWSGQFVNKHKDGTYYDEEATISPIRNENGVITNFVAVKRDMTEERRLEAQLMQSQKMEAIGTLAGGIAHDFNNILSLILGYTELAMKLSAKNTKIFDSLTEVTQAGNRAKDLVQQILAFSRQSEQQKKPVQVHLIVKEALKMLRSSLPATIQIKQDLQSESIISADPTQIHQIVMNLCTNAYHAMRDEGGTLHIHLTDVTRRHLRSNDNQQQTLKYLKVTVSDTGHGIPPEIINRIFEPYFTTKGKSEGTGLGLAIIHGIVNSHDGHIEVSSKLGQGTTFDIYFPVVDEAEEISSDEVLEIEDVTTANILFVDDEKSLTELYTKVLESFGHNVTPATSAAEALRLLKRKPSAYNIVVTDLTMPKMTGITLATQMQQVMPGLPVILCSGYSENVDCDKFKEAGIRELIIKPIPTMKLISSIETIMEGIDGK